MDIIVKVFVTKQPIENRSKCGDLILTRFEVAHSTILKKHQVRLLFLIPIQYRISSGRRHCDRMVVGFTTIYNEHASADSHVIFSW